MHLWFVLSVSKTYVRTYAIHLLGTYVTILCNWLILWQNTLYLHFGRSRMYLMLGLVPLNPIVWCCVCYYVWHYVWLNVVINKVSLLLSKIMVTWIFGHYHIVHEMHSMWFMWFSHRWYRSQFLCKLIILVLSR